MVQLPVENERKEGIREGGKDGREAVEEEEEGQGLPALKRFIALAEAGLEVTGYPLSPTLPPSIILPPLHLALRAPLPLCSANQANSFLRGVEEHTCECV